MLAQGAKAPDFCLLDRNGNPNTLDSLLATGDVLIAFFKISCPTCQLSVPFLERLHESGRLRVVGISQDNAHDTKEFAEDFDLSFPMLLDTWEEGFPASNAYGITHVPSLFLISAGGDIRRTLQGFSRADLEELGSGVNAAVFRPEDRVPGFKPG